ncbi:tyrosine-type recombinase/integrase [Heliorestis acidaminivorans]|uniref:Tyrosine-type recombinase/integrase n=1 Tax=Heliorestis acidaminivorans TaxID=553427 RepID=A0A6I0EPD9_9FIRM|nr:tyrosine-type recombinase/integrase [Heliorestis acidaminivorans]KAB2950890.1 tyrosine-type recombinase/integrase [Heliorestis acidaminivorans]
MKYNWKPTGNNKVDNLGRQLAKTIRTMNQNRFETRERYIQTMQRFIHHTSKEFNLQKLSNIQDKHLQSYVQSLKNEGRADKYIKTELSAIRFFHNHMPIAKHELSDSRAFNWSVGLGSTPDNRGIDRAWTEREVQGMKDIANNLGRQEISSVIECMRSTGTRIDEAITLRDSHLRNAISTGKLSLTNTKGGRPREVLLTDRARDLFERQLQVVGRGEYAFTPKNYVESHKIHDFKQSIQNFLYNHREKIQETGRASSGHNIEVGGQSALTSHGLRHTFAREQYFELRDKGLDKEDARLEVAEMLGHSRDSIAYVYLGGLE